MKFTTDLHLVSTIGIMGSVPIVPFLEFMKWRRKTLQSYLYLYHISIPCIAVSVNKRIPFSLSRIMITASLLQIVLWVALAYSMMFTLTSWLVSTKFGTVSYQCFFSNFTPFILYMVKCSWPHTHTHTRTQTHTHTHCLYHVSLPIVVLTILGMLI